MARCSSIAVTEDHTAREAKDHFVIANLLADTLNGVVDDFCRGPQGFTLADVTHEALQHAHTLTGVGHFRVELHAVEAFFFVGHNGKRAVVGAGDGDEVRRDGGDFVAVAHPHVQQRFAVCGQGVFDTAHQRAVVNHFNLRIAELALAGAFYVAAQLHCHGLHTVANAEYRHASFEHVLRRARAVLFGGAFRAAGQDDAAWIEFANLCFRDIPRPQFTVNAQFTHATRHQLSVLRTEVQDENAMFMNVFRH